MPNLATDLARVMELLEKATPGPWEPLFPMELGDRITDIRSDADGVLVAGCQYQMDGRAITAAINFLRKYGPEIADTLCERETFMKALGDPSTLHAMMLRGQVAIPTWRSIVDLRGEVPNGEDRQLARIAELQEQVAAPLIAETFKETPNG